jgi:RNA polymerase sigma-54 factor
MTKLELCLSPRLGFAFHTSMDTVLTAELLSMSDEALHERLLAEAATNPALIVERGEPERRACGREPALSCAAHAWSDDNPPAPEHPALRLIADAGPALTVDDRPLALEIAFGLDRRGFRTSTVEELSAALGVSVERTRRIIDVLQAAGPEGIATSGPRECLIAHLEALDPRPRWAEAAIRLLECALEDLARGRLDAAARRVGVGRSDVEEALAGMKRHARPYPDWDPPGQANASARADVLVDLVDDRLIVRLAEDHGLTVRVDERLRTDDPRLARAARDADAWVRRVRTRGDSVLTVAQATVSHQEIALRRGLAHLRPLTRREVARVTGLPESTVSRVVSQRMIRTPSGRLLPFAALFGVALDALSTLAQLIAQGPAPRSDRELAEAMSAAGHPVARRTVAKYRARLRIYPPAATATGEMPFARPPSGVAQART